MKNLTKTASLYEKLNSPFKACSYKKPKTKAKTKTKKTGKLIRKSPKTKDAY